MRDAIFALFALSWLIAFCVVVIWRVPHLDMIVVFLIGLALACYDIATQVRARKD